MYELKKVVLDGKTSRKLKCPKCGLWGYIDDEQYRGKVSVLCPKCGFHETVDFSAGVS